MIPTNHPLGLVVAVALTGLSLWAVYCFLFRAYPKQTWARWLAVLVIVALTVNSCHVTLTDRPLFTIWIPPPR